VGVKVSNGKKMGLGTRKVPKQKLRSGLRIGEKIK
jgi:hypothetical protein